MAKTQNAVEKIRTDIRRLQADLDALDGAPLPREEIARRVSATLDAMVADRAKRAVPQGLVSGTVDSGEIERTLERPDWLLMVFRTQIEDWLMAHVDAHLATHPPGLPAAERQAKHAEIAAAILDLERREEALIEHSEAAGAPIARRPDADPRAVFSIGG